MHAEHVLHGLARHADLLADDALAVAQASREYPERDRVGVVHLEVETAVAQGRHGASLPQRRIELGGERVVKVAPR